MRPQLLIRIVIVVSTVLLCAGFGVYSFLRLNTTETHLNYNLYKLVPQDAIAVFETDNVIRLIEDMKVLSCNQNEHLLHISELFSYLSKYFLFLEKEAPHGLSKQMNRILVSFHEPNSSINQILYCNMAGVDHELVKSFWEKYLVSSNFSFKDFKYRGKRIFIFPIENNRFIAVYFTKNFLAISFQKKQIEHVIDALQDNKSLMHNKDFLASYVNRNSNAQTMLYVCMKKGEVTQARNALSPFMPLKKNWYGFDLKFGEDFLFCSGMPPFAEAVSDTLVNMQQRGCVEGFPNLYLPSSTFYYTCSAISEKDKIENFASVSNPVLGSDDYEEKCNEEYVSFLKDHALSSAVTGSFMSPDSSDCVPCTVLVVPLKNSLSAERQFRSLLYSYPEKATKKSYFQQHLSLSNNQRYRIYTLPGNALLTKLTGFISPTNCTYACFYRGCFLLAADVRSLSIYLQMLEDKNVLAGIGMGESANYLSPVYNFLMVSDLGKMDCRPKEYVISMIPEFFLHQPILFSPFIVAIQIVYIDDNANLNVLLFNKGEE